jgi:hypothetical protein
MHLSGSGPHWGTSTNCVHVQHMNTVVLIPLPPSAPSLLYGVRRCGAQNNDRFTSIFLVSLKKILLAEAVLATRTAAVGKQNLWVPYHSRVDKIEIYC